MKLLYLFFTLIFFVNICFSNDSGIIAVGGTWVVMKGEHPTIQMVRETIDVNVYGKYYDVIAEFTFKNNGDACDVYMGFPEFGAGDMHGYKHDTTGYIMFSTTVNGKTVEAKREIAKDEMSSGDNYKAYWIKQVSFKSDEIKKIIVKYRSPHGSGISYYGGSENFIQYNFSGGNWCGKVLESKMNIYFHIPVEIVYSPYSPKVTKELDHYTYYRTNWEAEEYFVLSFKIKENKEESSESY